MRVIQWITDKIAAQLATLIGGLVISRMETEALQSHFDQLENIENQAHQLEADGKTQLAAQLRNCAESLSLDRPGEQANMMAGYLEKTETPLTTDVADKPKKLRNQSVKKPKGGNTSKPRRGRPPKSNVSPSSSSSPHSLEAS